MRITSTQNPRILRLMQLSKSHNRQEANLFVIEGFREISKALSAGFTSESLFYCPELISTEGRRILDSIPLSVDQVEINHHVFEKIAYRDNKDGIILLSVPVYRQLEDYIPGKNPLIMVVETIEKPGNLGALLRTADAAGLDAVLVCDPQTDIYNPNVIRSSLGCIFTNQVISCTSEAAITYLKARSITIYAASLQTSILYTSVDFRVPSAIVLGSEAEGLSKIWLDNADKMIRIPMAGEADSLNVSVSAGIILFEAVRQRGQGKKS